VWVVVCWEVVGVSNAEECITGGGKYFSSCRDVRKVNIVSVLSVR
jgi:hypothetical protein